MSQMETVVAKETFFSYGSCGSGGLIGAMAKPVAILPNRCHLTRLLHVLYRRLTPCSVSVLEKQTSPAPQSGSEAYALLHALVRFVPKPKRSANMIPDSSPEVSPSKYTTARIGMLTNPGCLLSDGWHLPFCANLLRACCPISQHL